MRWNGKNFNYKIQKCEGEKKKNADKYQLKGEK